MTIQLVPLPFPSTADAARLANFGREVRGVDPGNLTDFEFQEIKRSLYKFDVLLFRNTVLTPERQYALTKAFDPVSENYGHGNNTTEAANNSILHPDLKTIPRVPQVQLIGNGTVYNHEGLVEAKLKHPSHKTFHRTVVSDEDEANGVTRFYRWHIDAALYNLSPPKVTTLYGLKVPNGPSQTCRYDDGTGDELDVPLGTTAFVSGQTMFSILPDKLKSVAVRSRVKYAPHPYVWMASAHAKSTGLGIESEGLEKPLNELPAWEESRCKVYPVLCGSTDRSGMHLRLVSQLWKNPLTGALSFQVHPCAVAELIIDALPDGAQHEGALFPDGAHLTNLTTVRELLYTMQRPGIAPSENDLVLFHNRGVLHSVVGAFAPEEVRAFHQCNLAASDEPVGPGSEDVKEWA